VGNAREDAGYEQRAITRSEREPTGIGLL